MNQIFGTINYAPIAEGEKRENTLGTSSDIMLEILAVYALPQ